MGRGDKKSRKGKLSMGTYGVSRPRRSSKITKPATTTIAKDPKKKETKVKTSSSKTTAPKATKPTTSKKATVKKAQAEEAPKKEEEK